MLDVNAVRDDGHKTWNLGTKVSLIAPCHLAIYFGSTRVELTKIILLAQHKPTPR